MSLWERMRHNLGLKLLSLFTAFVIWGTVQVQTDPVVARRKTVKVVPVQVPKSLAPVSVDPPHLTVTLVGRVSAFEHLEESNFRLAANLAKGTAGACTAILEPDDLPPGLQVRDLPRKTVTVELDALVEAMRPVFVEVRGHPAQGFAAGTWTVHPNAVRLSAPSSIVQRVHRVVAEVDVSGLSSTFSGGVSVSARDTSNLQVAGVDLHPPEVTVTLPLRQVNSKTVPVVPVVGDLPEGYEIASIAPSPPVVTLTGAPGLLAGIDSVQTAPISSAQLTGRTVVAVPLRVPPGCSILGPSAIRVTFTLRPRRTNARGDTPAPAPAAEPETADRRSRPATGEPPPRPEGRERPTPDTNTDSSDTPPVPETSPAEPEAARPRTPLWERLTGRHEPPRPPAPPATGERP